MKFTEKQTKLLDYMLKHDGVCTNIDTRENKCNYCIFKVCNSHTSQEGHKCFITFRHDDEYAQNARLLDLKALEYINDLKFKMLLELSE